MRSRARGLACASLLLATGSALAAVWSGCSEGGGGQGACGGPGQAACSGGSGGGDTAGQGSSSTTTSTSTGSTGSTGSGGGEPGEWVPVAGLEECHGERLVLPAAEWPQREWTSCGKGCQQSIAGHLGTQQGSRSASAASYLEGDLVLRTSMLGKDHYAEEIVSLTTGAPEAVFRYKGSACLAVGGKEDAALLPVIRLSASKRRWVGRFDRENGEFYPAPALYDFSSYLPAFFTFNQGWGLIDGGSLKLTAEPGSGDLTAVFTGGALNRARARGDLVVWVDWDAIPTALQSWTAKEGQRVLFQGPGDISGLAVSDERIAYLGGFGPLTFDGQFDALKVYWTALTSDPAQVDIVEGPDLTGMIMGGSPMATAGDYITISTGGSDESPRAVYVVHVPTKTMRQILTKPDRALFVAAMSPKEIVLMETTTKSFAYFQRWLRFDLAELDALVEGYE